MCYEFGSILYRINQIEMQHVVLDLSSARSGSAIDGLAQGRTHQTKSRKLYYYKHITVYIEWIYNRRPLGNTTLCFMIIKTYLDVCKTRFTTK